MNRIRGINFMKNARSKRGFTLLEILMGTGVFSIGIVGSVGLLGWIGRADAANTRTVSAAAIGQAKLEEIREAGYAGAATGTEDDGYYDLAWTITQSSNYTGMRTVNLTVSWVDQDGAHKNLSMSTLLTEEEVVAVLPGFALTGQGGDGGIPGGVVVN
jgi:prepilin-type N-terminal cleavage/methylation domain-containing protein